MKNQSLQKLCARSKLYLDRHASTILTCIAAVGVIATAVMVADETTKATKLLETATKEKGEKLTVAETVKVAGPVYIPAVVTGAATISCIFGANVLNKKRQASLASAYALINEYHKEYRNKLIKLHGKEADEEIRNEMAREHVNFHVIGLDTPDNKVIFYEELSGETFVRYEREIMDAEYHLNRNFAMRGYASLNEFYEFLGLPQTEYGDAVGWTMSDGYCWIDFEHRLIPSEDGGPDMYSIDMIFGPHSEYLDDWE